MFRILYRFLAGFARLAVRSGRSKDLEIIVLRHQLQILRRQADQPAVNDNDRTLLGAIAAALTSRLRDGWVVTPETLLRWHRKRIARHWTQPVSAQYSAAALTRHNALSPPTAIGICTSS